MKDDTSVGNYLKIHQSGRNEGPTIVVLEKSSKSSSCDDDEECKEQVGYHLVTNEKAIKILADNDGCIERVGNDQRFPKRERRERRPPGEWWRNHIPSKHSKKGPMWHCLMII